MGIFSAKKCTICGKKIYFNYRYLVGGIVCTDCLYASGLFYASPSPTRDEVLKRIEGIKIKKEFIATQKIEDYILINENDKTWVATTGIKKYNFDDLVDYELIENGGSISSKGLGKAVAGGLLFGGVGAIVGGVTAKTKTKNILEEFKIVITVKDFDYPTLTINLLSGLPLKIPAEIQKVRKTAQEIISLLILIKNTQEEAKTNNFNKENSQFSVDDEILKFKDLLDKNIIIQEEFEKKKKQLLEM